VTKTQLAIFLLALFAISSCQKLADNKQECYQPSDCGEPLVCFLAVCQDPKESLSTLYVELSPPRDSKTIRQQLSTPVQIEQGKALNLILEKFISVSGKICQPSCEQGAALTGTLRLKGTTRIPGIDNTYETTVTQEGFRIDLLAGMYTVTFAPDDVNLPPFVYGGRYLFQLKDTDEQTYSIHLAYPSLEQFFILQGSVLQSATAKPIAGAKISAQAHAKNGRQLLSTTANTNSTGDYTLILAEAPKDLILNIRAGENPLVPEYKTTLESPVTTNEIASPLPPIYLGITDAVTVAVNLSGPSNGNFSSTTVVFSGDFGAGKLITTTQTGTDDTTAMHATLNLIPGSYLATVVPLRSQPWALTSTPVTILPSDNNTIMLPVESKVMVDGTLRDHTGAPVPDARITFVRKKLATERSFSTTSDGDGNYALALDPGTTLSLAEYTLEVEPTHVSGLPRYKSLFNLGTTPLVYHIYLYAPAFVYGIVRDAQETPVANVTLNFYAELGSEKAVLVGVAQTLKDGSFVLALPSIR